MDGGAAHAAAGVNHLMHLLDSGGGDCDLDRSLQAARKAVRIEYRLGGPYHTGLAPEMN